MTSECVSARPEHPAGNFKQTSRSVQALLMKYNFWFCAEMFGRRIFVLTHDLGLTLVGIPFFRANLVVAFFLEHLVKDPAEVAP
jgi:hypothetical protein